MLSGLHNPERSSTRIKSHARYRARPRGRIVGLLALFKNGSKKNIAHWKQSFTSQNLITKGKNNNKTKNKMKGNGKKFSTVSVQNLLEAVSLDRNSTVGAFLHEGLSFSPFGRLPAAASSKNN